MLYLVNKKFQEAWKYIDSRILLKNEIDITKRYDKLKTLIDLDVNKKESINFDEVFAKHIFLNYVYFLSCYL